VPFEGCFPRAFNIASVQRDAPACSGIYGLSDAREWIYIGETANVQGRLMELLQSTTSSAFLRGRMPTGFSFEICHPNSRFARQDRLVHEFEPVINRRPAPRNR